MNAEWKEGILFGLFSRAGWHDTFANTIPKVEDMADVPMLRDIQFKCRMLEKARLKDMSFKAKHAGSYTVDLNAECLDIMPKALADTCFTTDNHQVVYRASGRLSALSQVTLPGAARRAANIPEAAKYYAFACE